MYPRINSQLEFAVAANRFVIRSSTRGQGKLSEYNRGRFVNNEAGWRLASANGIQLPSRQTGKPGMVELVFFSIKGFLLTFFGFGVPYTTNIISFTLKSLLNSRSVVSEITKPRGCRHEAPVIILQSLIIREHHRSSQMYD